MGVLDNPLFQAVGEHLGLGGIFQQAQQGMQAAPPPAPGKSAPNVPEYRNRPYIPRNEMPGQRGGVMPGGTNPTTPGTMDPATLQDPNVQALLGKYGVHPSTEAPDPNLFVHNPEAFARHPILAGLLERGLEGVAFAHPGDDALSSLIGGVRGIQEAQAARANQVNAQVMAPVTQAEAIQKLVGTAENQTDAHLKAGAEVKRDNSMAGYYDSHAQTLEERAMQNARSVTGGPNKGQLLFPHYENGQFTGKWDPDPNFVPDPENVIRQNALDAGKRELVTKYGGEDKVPASEWQKLLAGQLSSESTAKEAGKNSGKITVARIAAGWHTYVAQHGGGSAHVDPYLRLEHQNLMNQGNKFAAEISKAEDPTKPMIDPDTNKVVAEPSKKAALAKKLIARLNATQARMQEIESGTASRTAPTTTPTFSPGNPFVK